MIEILLISFYVLSVGLCGYSYYKLTVKELKQSLGIMSAGVLFNRILLSLVPIVNIVIAIAYFMAFLYNTDIKFDMKDNP